MAIYGTCKKCGGQTRDYGCQNCLYEEVQELKEKLKVADFQISEARDVLAHLADNLRAAGGVFVGPADMADALLSKWAEQSMEAIGLRASNEPPTTYEDNVKTALNLIGEVVLVKAQNIGIAEWESGVLESVDHQPDGESRAFIRMKDKQLHRVSLREFTVKKR